MRLVLICPSLGLLPAFLCETGIQTDDDVDPASLVRRSRQVERGEHTLS